MIERRQLAIYATTSCTFFSQEGREGSAYTVLHACAAPLSSCWCSSSLRTRLLCSSCRAEGDEPAHCSSSQRRTSCSSQLSRAPKSSDNCSVSVTYRTTGRGCSPREIMLPCCVRRSKYTIHLPCQLLVFLLGVGGLLPLHSTGTVPRSAVRYAFALPLQIGYLPSVGSLMELLRRTCSLSACRSACSDSPCSLTNC